MRDHFDNFERPLVASKSLVDDDSEDATQESALSLLRDDE